MNTKISDFAMRYGISDRHARRLLSDNEDALSGHYTRNTKGTWIDEYAADFLRQLLRNPLEILPAEQLVSVEDLQEQIKRMESEQLKIALALADAERRAGENAGAAALLTAAETREQSLIDENKTLTRENTILIQKKFEAELALTAAEEENKTLSDVAEMNAQEAEKAKAEAAELQAKLAKVKAYYELPVIKRLFVKPPKIEEE